MSERHDINRNMDAITFCSFYYLKDELVSFCKANGLPTSGGKIEISNRIAHYLDTNEILSTHSTRKTTPYIKIINEDSKIEPNFVCSEKHRTFFKEKIGNTFSFNVSFRKWLKGNAGKTYSQAIEAYYQILEEKRAERLRLTNSSSTIHIFVIFLKITTATA